MAFGVLTLPVFLYISAGELVEVRAMLQPHFGRFLFGSPDALGVQAECAPREGSDTWPVLDFRGCRSTW